jgi:hypothetical protein
MDFGEGVGEIGHSGDPCLAGAVRACYERQGSLEASGHAIVDEAAWSCGARRDDHRGTSVIPAGDKQPDVERLMFAYRSAWLPHEPHAISFGTKVTRESLDDLASRMLTAFPASPMANVPGWVLSIEEELKDCSLRACRTACNAGHSAPGRANTACALRRVSPHQGTRLSVTPRVG